MKLSSQVVDVQTGGCQADVKTGHNGTNKFRGELGIPINVIRTSVEHQHLMLKSYSEITSCSQTLTLSDLCKMKIKSKTDLIDKMLSRMPSRQHMLGIIIGAMV